MSHGEILRSVGGHARAREIGLYFAIVGRGAEAARGILDYVLRKRLAWQLHSPETLPQNVKLAGAIINSSDFRAKFLPDTGRPLPMVDINFDPAATETEPLARELARKSGYARVLPDERANGRVVADYFLERGFVNFAFFGFEHFAYSLARQEGFEKRLRERGRSMSNYVNPGETWENMLLPPAIAQTDKWLAGLPKPVAIMAATDVRARHVIAGCQRLRLLVPHAVAVCGVNDELGPCEISTPTLSSLPINSRQIGYESARLLDKLLAGGSAPKQPVLVEPPPVITRQSSDIFAAEDPDVSAALRYIYENADRPMLVEQVADAVAVSRAHLDRRFRQFHGRTVQQEIWRAHVERAKRLLVTTQADTRAIARAAGFHNAQRLSVVFSREMRMTPSAYRKANTPR